MGPWTVTMPRWPGPALIVIGIVLVLGALGAVEAARTGDLDVDARTLGLAALAGAILFATGLLWVAIRQIKVRAVLPPERYRGPTALVLIGLVLVVAGVMTAPFSGDALALESGRELTTLGAIVILLATPIALGLVSWLFVFRPRALAALPSLPGRDPQRAIAFGAGIGMVAWIGSTIVIGIVVFILESIGRAPEPEVAERAIAMLDPWLVVIAIVILAPIAEEIFFRGIIFNAFLREAGRRYAYIGSAAIFGFIHLSLVTLVPIFLLALALAWVYERSGSLLAPIAAHMTVNGISVAIALLYRFDIIRLPV